MKSRIICGSLLCLWMGAWGVSFASQEDAALLLAQVRQESRCEAFSGELIDYIGNYGSYGEEVNAEKLRGIEARLEKEGCRLRDLKELPQLQGLLSQLEGKEGAANELLKRFDVKDISGVLGGGNGVGGVEVNEEVKRVIQEELLSLSRVHFDRHMQKLEGQRVLEASLVVSSILMLLMLLNRWKNRRRVVRDLGVLGTEVEYNEACGVFEDCLQAWLKSDGDIGGRYRAALQARRVRLTGRLPGASGKLYLQRGSCQGQFLIWDLKTGKPCLVVELTTPVEGAEAWLVERAGFTSEGVFGNIRVLSVVSWEDAIPVLRRMLSDE